MIKVITLKQPWASLIANGYKKYEFRSWNTKYRGKLYIHAGKGIDREYIKKYKSLNIDFPSSKVLAVCNLEDVIKLDKETNKKINQRNEFIYGNNNREGYAWVLSDVKKISSNKTINGKLSIWSMDEKEL